MPEDMATELLQFIDSPLERFKSEDAKHAYQLMRTRIFLEKKFGHLEKQIEVLRKEREMMMPIVSAWSERQDLARRNHPFAYLGEETEE